MEKDWSVNAKNFDELQRYIVGEETENQIKNQLASLNNLGNVLELGCGNGKLTVSIAPNSKHITATDISQEMLQVAKARLTTFDNITVQQADCYATDYDDNSFDTLFMANLIHGIAKPEQALNEALRLLKPNGSLIILSYTKDGLTPLNKLKMIYRYLKVFGKPPQQGTSFGLKTLIDFINDHHFKVETANLLGNKQSKAMFVVAKIA